MTRTAAGDNQARTAAHLLSPEPVPGSPEPSGPPPGQLTGWQDHARASAAIYSPAPATGQLQPAFKLERSLTQSRRAETVAGYPKPSGPQSGATGRRRAVVGGQAGEDSDSPAPAGVVRGSGLRRKSRAGRSRTRPGSSDGQPVSAHDPIREKPNRAGRAQRHGGTRTQHVQAVEPVRLGTARYGSIQDKFSQSSSSHSYTRTLPASLPRGAGRI